MSNRQFYNASLKKYPDCARAVHWASQERQQVRFEVFKGLLENDLKTSSVVDAGCGLADLYFFFKENKLLPCRYIGIDIHSKMVLLARQRSQQEILQRDILRDALPKADYYLCSGALNILDPFETILCIKKMLYVSEKGLIFNILKGEDSGGIYNKYSVEKMQELLSFFDGAIQIIDNYLDDDFTVYLKKLY